MKFFRKKVLANQMRILTGWNGETPPPPSYSHYASPTGTATWAEAVNLATPCSLLTACQNIGPGNVVGLRGGTYDLGTIGPSSGTSAYDPVFRPTFSGTVLSPITFKAYLTEVPFIPGYNNYVNGLDQWEDTAAFGVSGQNYVIWDGIHGQLAETVTNGQYNTNWLGVMYQSTGSKFVNCYLQGNNHGDPVTGGNSAPARIEQCTDCSLDNCEIFGNIGYQLLGTDQRVNVCGVWLMTNTNAEIKNCEFHTSTNAILQKLGVNAGTHVHHTFFHDIEIMNVHLNDTVGASTGGLVHDNLILGLIDTSTGIYIEGSTPGSTATHTINNNTIVRCHYGIQGGPQTLASNNFHSNAIYGCFQNVSFYDASRPASNYQGYFGHTTFFGALLFIDSYYTLAQWQTAYGQDANSIDSDPLFVNSIGTTIADYDYQVGSPYLTAGFGGGRIGMSNPAEVGIH